MRARGGLHFDLILGIALRGLGALSSFVFVWLVARVFGAEIVGVYQLAFVTMTLLALVCVQGLDALLIREVGRLIRGDELATARAWFEAAGRSVGRLGLVATAGLVVAAWPLSHFILKEPRLTPYLIVMAPGVALLARLRVSNAFLRSTDHKIASQTLEGVTYTTLAALAVGAIWLSGRHVSGLVVPTVFVLAAIVVVALSNALSRRLADRWPAGASATIDRKAGITIAAGPIASQVRDWLALLLITTQLGLADAGIFRVAFQFCLLFQLVNNSFAMMAGPHLARMAAGHEFARIKRAVSTTGLLGLGLCLPMGVLVAVASDWLLALFGPQFVRGALALELLAIGQLVNVAFGPVGSSLVMLHKERAVLVVEVVASLVGLAVGLALLPRWGMAGMAMGMSVSAILSNSANAINLRLTLAAQRATAAA